MNKITITLNTGCRITLNQPEKLGDCEKDKKVSLVFNNGQIYSGWFVGFYEEDDENDIVLKREDSKFNIGLPYDRLVGWYYE